MFSTGHWLVRATCPVPVQVHMIEYEEFHRNGDYLIWLPNYMKCFPQGSLGRVIKSIGVSARALAGYAPQRCCWCCLIRSPNYMTCFSIGMIRARNKAKDLSDRALAGVRAPGFA